MPDHTCRIIGQPPEHWTIIEGIAFGRIEDLIIRVVATKWGQILSYKQETQVMQSLPSLLGDKAPLPTDPAFIIDVYLDQEARAESLSLSQAGVQNQPSVSENNFLNLLVQGAIESWPWRTLTEMTKDLTPTSAASSPSSSWAPGPTARSAGSTSTTPWASSPGPASANPCKSTSSQSCPPWKEKAPATGTANPWTSWPPTCSRPRA